MSIPQIASSQESKNLFDSRLRARVEKLERNASMRVEIPHCSLDAKLQTLLSRLQRSIVEQIKMLKTDPRLPPFYWLRENVNLQNFYCSLRHLPKAALPLEACIEIRIGADKAIGSLVTSRNSLSMEERDYKQREILADTWYRIGRIAFNLEWKTEDLELTIKEAWHFLIMRSKAAAMHALGPEGQIYDALLPKEIAKLLLTREGYLNLGIITPIKERFFPETRLLSEGEKGMVFVLDRIDSSWQSFFDQIKVPCDPSIPSNALIRAELNLLPNEKITKLHCQQVVLAALLSQLSSKQVSECLTRAWMLRRLPEFFFELLDDFAELIHFGYLTRMIDGKIDTFFFENACDDASLFQKIVLKKKKHVLEFSGAPFWKCPQLIAACRQMGMEDLEARISTLLEQIAPEENSEKQVTWDKLVRTCANSMKNSQHSPEELIALGRYGFSLGANRLLKAWEACLAGTVDYLSDFSVRANINETVMCVFGGFFRKSGSPYERALMKERESKLSKLFNDSFRLVYNEAIPLPYAFDDGRYTCSGFKLFQRDVYRNNLKNREFGQEAPQIFDSERVTIAEGQGTSENQKVGVRPTQPKTDSSGCFGITDLNHKGTRIETPVQFQTFILNLLNTFSIPEIDDLQECVLQKDFVKRVICEYDHENTQVSDPVKKYNHLGQTPMTSLCFEYCPDHLTIDSMAHFNPDIRTVFLKNPDGLFKLSKPKELLKWMLGLSQFSQELFYSELFATGEELQDFLLSKLGAEEWIQKTLVEPGLMVSRAKMEQGSKRKYQERIKTFLGEQSPGRTPRSIGRMETFFKEMDEEMTVQQFAQRSYVGLLRVFKNETDAVKSLGLMLDTLFLESLPDGQLDEIQQSAVRFAEIEDSSLFFCCFFNPRTELLEFGSMTEYKTGLKLIGAQQWQEKAKKAVAKPINPSGVASSK